MSSLKIFNAKLTEQLLPSKELVSAMLEAFEKVRLNTAIAPNRIHMEQPGGGMFLLMPACDPVHTALKIVTVHTKNAPAPGAVGRLPVVQGEVQLSDSVTGERLALMDGAVLTRLRTAALSAAAFRKLERPAPRSVLLFGSGVQAAAHARFFTSLYPNLSLNVTSMDLAQAKDLCESLSKEFPNSGPFQAVSPKSDTLPDIQRAADLIICCTTATKPIVKGEVKKDATIIGMGAYLPHMAEVSPAIIHQAIRSSGKVYVDFFPGAQKEAGDLIQANLNWKNDVLGISHVGDDEIAAAKGNLVFIKTVGHAVWDLAAAQLAWKQYLKTAKL